jgi:hypothetical protein
LKSWGGRERKRERERERNERHGNIFRSLLLYLGFFDNEKKTIEIQTTS